MDIKKEIIISQYNGITKLKKQVMKLQKELFS